MRENLEKAKYMAMERRHRTEDEYLAIDSEGTREKVQRVESFNYLGVTITLDAGTTKEIKERLNKVIATARTMKCISAKNDISSNAIEEICKTVIRPTATHAYETWILNRRDYQSIHIRNKP